jgi:hypothetical protein
MEANGKLYAPAVLTLRERNKGTIRIKGWLDPRVGLDVLEKRKVI